jgi:acetylornithine deacetylase/succinyl-diaminopimelate desuccinylase-like protein
MAIDASGFSGALWQHPTGLLQKLIQFDTTNPPGNEVDCIVFIAETLANAGLESKLLAAHDAHPNLVTRLPGRGEAPPFLMYGHVDVVTTEGQDWTFPPFEGRLAEGSIWGRGALDMKGGLVMMICALLRARASGVPPPGDVILAVVSGEETRSEHGAAYLVAHHAPLFEGVRYAISEFGGFTLHLGGARLYPIMVSEKQLCWLRATIRGQAGHGSMPVHGQAMAKLAALLLVLDRRRLPVRITPVARQTVEGVVKALPFPQNLILRQLLKPRLTDRVLPLLGSAASAFDPVLRNTISATILHASDKINVIPGEVSVELDGRLLPGCSPDDMLAELRPLVGDDIEWEVLKFDPGPPEPNMGMFATLADILEEADPGGSAVPLILPGVTDASQFSRLGIQTYGFTPMKMPPGFSFWEHIHSADERLPVDALEFGIEATYQLLQRFH